MVLSSARSSSGGAARIQLHILKMSPTGRGPSEQAVKGLQAGTRCSNAVGADVWDDGKGVSKKTCIFSEKSWDQMPVSLLKSYNKAAHRLESSGLVMLQNWCRAPVVPFHLLLMAIYPKVQCALTQAFDWP
jgi:hypothetical protein